MLAQHRSAVNKKRKISLSHDDAPPTSSAPARESGRNAVATCRFDGSPGRAPEHKGIQPRGYGSSSAFQYETSIGFRNGPHSR